VPDSTATLANRFSQFIERHWFAWELGLGVLAIVYVALPFLAEGPLATSGSLLALLETILTLVFVVEFATRLAASDDKVEHLRRHWIDAIALIPVVRGVRIARLLRLGRMVRTFAGVQRASSTSKRLAPYQTVFNLVVAWVAIMLFSAATFYAAENGVNPSVHDPGDALWWSIATITGGPDQVVPATEEGRIAAAVLLLLGVAIFAAFTASLISLVAGSHEDQHLRSRLSQLVDLRDSGDLTAEAFFGRVYSLARGRDADTLLESED
jgi:voltage-gated potassium channel